MELIHTAIDKTVRELIEIDWEDILIGNNALDFDDVDIIDEIRVDDAEMADDKKYQESYEKMEMLAKALVLKRYNEAASAIKERISEIKREFTGGGNV